MLLAPESRRVEWEGGRFLPRCSSSCVAEYEGCCKRLFREADAALYRAKAMGKNCVIQTNS